MKYGMAIAAALALAVGGYLWSTRQQAETPAAQAAGKAVAEASSTTGSQRTGIRPANALATGPAEPSSLAPAPPALSLGQRFDAATDLLKFVEEIEHSGLHDGKAARYIARAMSDCAFLQSATGIASKQRLWAFSRADMRPGTAQMRQSMGEQLIERCRGLAGQRPGLRELAKQWEQRAESLGDLKGLVDRTRRIMLPIDRANPEQVKEFSRSAEQLLQTAMRGGLDDREAMDLANFLVSEHGRAMFNPSSPLGMLANQRSPGFAAMIACGLGADCSGSGYILRQSCLQNGICGYQSIQDLLRTESMGTQQLARLEQYTAEVMALLRAGDVAQLTAARSDK